jgi:hypothetical protein
LRFRTVLLSGALYALVLPVPALVQAQALAVQSGEVSPLTNGWTRVGSASEGPSDGGWFIHTQFEGTDLQYARSLDEAALSMIGEAGWTVTVISRFSGNGPGTAFVSRVLLTTSKAFEIRFFRPPSSGPYVELVTDPGEPPLLHFISGEINGFHRFDLAFFPEDGAAILLVDGSRKLTGYRGHATSVETGHLSFGIPMGAMVGITNFRHIQLSVGNDPVVPAVASTWGGVKAHYRGSP